MNTSKNFYSFLHNLKTVSFLVKFHSYVCFFWGFAFIAVGQAIQYNKRLFHIRLILWLVKPYPEYLSVIFVSIRIARKYKHRKNRNIPFAKFITILWKIYSVPATKAHNHRYIHQGKIISATIHHWKLYLWHCTLIPWNLTKMIKPHRSIWKWTKYMYNFNLIIKACSFCHFNGNHGLQKTLDIVNILYSFCCCCIFHF